MTTKTSFRQRVIKDFKRNKGIYLMLLPVLIYYAVFHYGPMYGAQIAFRDFSPVRGIAGSQWVGLENFQEFFNGIYFWRLIRNTVTISLLDVIFGFPAPILLALMLNEVTNEKFKRFVQTTSYLPYFISVVVVVGLIIDFFARDGLVNGIMGLTGDQRIGFMSNPSYYWAIYVGSGVWQTFGYGSIIYLAAISSIDPQLYDAAKVDGAGRFRQLLNITLPGIAPTIITLFILRVGAMLSIGSEKTILLYNPLVYESADIISSYVYRTGVLNGDYSLTAAIGLFNSLINFTLLLIANGISRRRSETSLF
ncbi:MAG: ABC transporter permease subunit [Chloroflexota bacterium]|jgi:putative aldouronate transport system permease protein|nr:ABC transporter permease subunit [Chloroflexota bacterium]